MKIPLMTVLITAMNVVCLLSACSGVSDERVERTTSLVSGDIGHELDARLSPFVERIMRDHGAASVVVGVARGDQIVYARAFGYQNIETEERASLETVYHMSSLSKPFVATAVMKLVEQGRVNLDDRIVVHLPYFTLQGEDSDRVTILDVLTHSSGIPRDIGSNDWESQESGDDALEQYVRSFADERMEFAPGSQFAYSNSAMNCIGDLIAKASGMSFEEYVQQYVLEPAGMTESTFLKPIPTPSDWAMPHVLTTTTRVWDVYPYNRRHAPSATLHSNVLEMCRWGMITLNQGSHAGITVLEPEFHDQLLKPWRDTPWGQIGLNWFLQEHEGRRTILHTGEDTGFSSQIVLYPDEDLCIVVLANLAESRVARIGNAAAEVVFGLEIKDYVIPGRIEFGKRMDEAGIESAKKLWASLQTDPNYTTGEWQINLLGHGLIWEKRYEEAKQVFGFNIDEYPESANVYDSYGDALLAEGDQAGALEYFRKAVEVDASFTESLPKIEKLLSGD